MAFLAPLIPALTIAGTAVSIGTSIAAAVKAPPKPPVIAGPDASKIRDKAMETRRRASAAGGRRSTILTGASALLETDDDPAENILGG